MVRKKNQKKFKKPLSEKKSSIFDLPVETKKYIFGTISIFSAIIIVLGFFGKAGVAGRGIISALTFLIGKAVFLMPLALVLTGLVFFTSHYKKFFGGIIIAFFLLVLGTAGIFGVIFQKEKIPEFSKWFDYLSNLWQNREILKDNGGFFGCAISFPFLKLFDFWVTQIILIGMIISGALIFWSLLRKPKEIQKPEVEKGPSLIKRIFFPKFKVKEIEPSPDLGEMGKEKEILEEPSLKLKTEPVEVTSKMRRAEYQKPPLEFLESEKGIPSAGDIRINSAIIKKTLENFSIPVEMGEINIGPTVTQYTLKPAEGIKLSKITALSNDLALALASHPIRIEAPIPGRPLVGIEVPNKVRTKVRLRDLISLPQFQNSSSNLIFVLGRDVSGNPIYADLAKMPHLLVAGSTGTGKTCAADTLLFTEKGMLTFEELCPLPLNSEIDFKIKLITRDGIEETAKNYNNGICQFYKLTTRRGYQIEATAEHPLWVMNEDGSQSWKPASLIKEGDYVAICRGPALFGNKIDISDFKPRRSWGNTKKISLPSKMTPQLAQFLGLLTADGGVSVERKGIHRVVYSQANQELLSLYKKLLKELFGITQFIEKRSGSNPNNKANDITVNSIHLKEFLTYLGMKSIKAPQKEIPRAIREAPKEIVVSYLKALFDNDGYSGEKIPVELSLSSKKLLSQVQIMLLNFGIVSSLKPKKVKNYPQNEYFRLSIYGEDARKFVKEIGFLREEKYQKVKKLFELRANPNVDVIPNISSLLKKIGQKYLNKFARLTNRGWQYQLDSLVPKHAFSSLKSYNSGERMPSYQSLKKILDFYQPIAQELEYQELEKILQRNFYWDKVAKITRTSGIGYDFFVPGSDSFVGNGFINHNTIFLNSLILSFLYQNSPEILRFILIDPKRVEFSLYQGLPHLLCPVIFDAQKTVNILKGLILEMERRFDILSEEKCRDISGYNQIASRNGIEPMPYIILIIDELADLMAARGREIEAGIVRLAQMARAVGIHLVVATQRPSVEVITGLIKANITSRITFKVASQVDSRTILDVAGAEKLLGSGDMLFLSAETGKPKRIQGAYVSEKEMKRVVNWIKEKIPSPLTSLNFPYLPLTETISEERKELDISQFKDFEGEDPLYEEAKKIVIQAKKASASLLQRKLSIGYARAARLIDMLEERGVVGPAEGAKPRQVYLRDKKENENDRWQKI